MLICTHIHHTVPRTANVPVEVIRRGDIHRCRVNRGGSRGEVEIVVGGVHEERVGADVARAAAIFAVADDVIFHEGQAFGIVLPFPFRLQGRVVHVDVVGSVDQIHTPRAVEVFFIQPGRLVVIQPLVAPDDIIVDFGVTEPGRNIAPVGVGAVVFVPVALAVDAAARRGDAPRHQIVDDGVVENLHVEGVIQRDCPAARVIFATVISNVALKKVVVDAHQRRIVAHVLEAHPTAVII